MVVRQKSSTSAGGPPDGPSWAPFLAELVVVLAGILFCYGTEPPWTVVGLFVSLAALELAFLRTRVLFVESPQGGSEDVEDGALLTRSAKGSARTETGGTSVVLLGETGRESQMIAEAPNDRNVNNDEIWDDKRGYSKSSGESGTTMVMNKMGTTSKKANIHSEGEETQPLVERRTTTGGVIFTTTYGQDGRHENASVDVSCKNQPRKIRDHRDEQAAVSSGVVDISTTTDDPHDSHDEHSPGCSPSPRPSQPASPLSASFSMTRKEPFLLSLLFMHDEELFASAEKYGKTPTGRRFRHTYRARFYNRFLFHLEREAESSGIVLGALLLPLLFSVEPDYMRGNGGKYGGASGGSGSAQCSAVFVDHTIEDATTATTTLAGALFSLMPTSDDEAASGVQSIVGEGKEARGVDEGPHASTTDSVLVVESSAPYNDSARIPFSELSSATTTIPPCPESHSHITMRAAHLVTSSCSAVTALFLLGYFFATYVLKDRGSRVLRKTLGEKKSKSSLAQESGSSAATSTSTRGKMSKMDDHDEDDGIQDRFFPVRSSVTSATPRARDDPAFEQQRTTTSMLSTSTSSLTSTRPVYFHFILTTLLTFSAGFAVLAFVYTLLEHKYFGFRAPPEPLTSAQLCFGLPAVFLGSMYVLLCVLRKSFTLGEAVLLSQCNVLLTYLFHLVIFQQRIRLTKLRCVILLGLFGAVFIAGHIFVLHYFCCKHRRLRKSLFTKPSYFFSVTTFISVALLFQAMSLWIQENSLLWIVKYVTQHSATPLKFILYYVVVLALGLSVGLPLVRNKLLIPDTVVEKAGGRQVEPEQIETRKGRSEDSKEASDSTTGNAKSMRENNSPVIRTCASGIKPEIISTSSEDIKKCAMEIKLQDTTISTSSFLSTNNATTSHPASGTTPELPLRAHSTLSEQGGQVSFEDEEDHEEQLHEDPGTTSAPAVISVLSDTGGSSSTRSPGGTVISTTAMNKRYQIMVRKYFHALAIVMFVPSVLIHIRFTSLAFAVAFAALVVLEAFRSADVEPIASLINRFIAPYLDRRDEGTVILTHMYLLLGCAVPVWYAFFVHGGIFNANSLLISLAGITATGVGDSAASIVGGCIGRHRWPGARNKKTLEGSFLGFFLSTFLFQVLLLYVVRFQGLSPASWARLVLADLLVATLEALTDQIDNLILPLFHAALLQYV
ncbi:unnamed protein product [Amoebophrya sp. A120]|nr:unnamed protein product [Amoebophrya sp. A120]|eukprot:GSA120T00017694001.1